MQDSEGHSLWDLTWYKAHAISANLTPSLLAESGLVPGPPAVSEGVPERESAATQQLRPPTLPEEEHAALLSGSEEVLHPSAQPVGTPAPAPASSEPGAQGHPGCAVRSGLYAVRCMLWPTCQNKWVP